MTEATIVAVYREGGLVHLETTVAEGDKDKFGRAADTVYVGSVPDDDAFAALTTAEQKVALVAAAKEEFDRVHSSASTKVPDGAL